MSSAKTLEAYTCERAALLAGAIQPALLQHYLMHSQEELAQVVEPALQRHMRAMQHIAQRVLSEGIDGIIASEPATADVFIAEVIAVATWHGGWGLPLSALAAPQPLPEPHPPCGLLATGERGEGAALWWIDGVLYLDRCREAGNDADMSHHWGGPRPGA